MRWCTRSGAARTVVIATGGFVPLLLALLVAPGMVQAGVLTAGAALGALVYLATTMQPALRGLAATASRLATLKVSARLTTPAA